VYENNASYTCYIITALFHKVRHVTLARIRSVYYLCEEYTVN